VATALPKEVSSFVRVYSDVARVVGKVYPKLGRTRLYLGCPEIAKRRRSHRDPMERRRSFAHTGHKRGVICVDPAVLDLGLGYQIGLMFHEFGHLIESQTTDQAHADYANLADFGLPIRYRGPLTLEWISPKVFYGP